MAVADAGPNAQADTPLVVRTIVGPTAAGKSAIALWLAARHAVTIISADSRQIYRGFDIGTAKPSAADRALAPHRGIDIVDPSVRYSAFAWAAAASGWIGESVAAGRIPVVVGGTGLYLRALYEPSFDDPPLDPVRRRRLDAFLAALTMPELRAWCAVLDPPRATLGRTQLLRSLEVALLAGQRLSALHVKMHRPPLHRVHYLLVDPGAALAERIAARARLMLTSGWVDEVRRLMITVPADAPAWNSTGYKTVRSLASGGVTAAAALERIIIDTRQYAKRQRTWFRHQLPAPTVTTIDPLASGWEARLGRWWEGEPVT